eukprot:5911680-Prymnesium_polylepis.1
MASIGSAKEQKKVSIPSWMEHARPLRASIDRLSHRWQAYRTSLSGRKFPSRVRRATAEG